MNYSKLSKKLPCIGRYRGTHNKCMECFNAGLCEYLSQNPNNGNEVIILNGQSFEDLITDRKIFSVGYFHERSNPKSSTSIERAAEILRHLNYPKFRTELVKETGMKSTTVHGILYRMREKGIVGYLDRKKRKRGQPRFWYRKILCETNPLKVTS